MVRVLRYTSIGLAALGVVMFVVAGGFFGNGLDSWVNDTPSERDPNLWGCHQYMNDGSGGQDCEMGNSYAGAHYGQGFALLGIGLELAALALSAIAGQISVSSGTGSPSNTGGSAGTSPTHSPAQGHVDYGGTGTASGHTSGLTGQAAPHQIGHTSPSHYGGQAPPPQPGVQGPPQQGGSYPAAPPSWQQPHG